jgi:hypothetical protein
VRRRGQPLERAREQRAEGGGERERRAPPRAGRVHCRAAGRAEFALRYRGGGERVEGGGERGAERGLQVVVALVVGVAIIVRATCSAMRRRPSPSLILSEMAERVGPGGGLTRLARLVLLLALRSIGLLGRAVEASPPPLPVRLLLAWDLIELAGHD